MLTLNFALAAGLCGSPARAESELDSTIAAAETADETPSFTALLGSWSRQNTATGNWGGRRDELERAGVRFSSSYSADFAGNVSGGQRRGAAYAGLWELGTGLDLGKIAGLEGLSFRLSGFWASGRSLSADDIGNLYAVQEIFTPAHVYLGEVSLSQSILDDTVTVQAGRLFASDVFATSPLWDYYVSGGIDANHGSIQANIFFPTLPIAAWGARAFYQPTRELHFVAGVYDASPNVAQPSKGGTDFSLGSDGVLALAQMTYEHDQTSDDAGLPGSASVGGYYDSNRFPQLDDPMVFNNGNGGFYLYFDQMLYRGSWPEFQGAEHLRAGTSVAERRKHPHVRKSAAPQDRSTGLTLWGALYVAPQQSINPQFIQAAGGLLYHGLLSSREHDVTAVAVISGTFSDKLPGQGAETVIEVNHRLQLTPWFYLTPDFQYVIHPNGFGNIGNAAVFAGEISINF